MGWVFNATPRPLYPPGKRPGALCIGGWMGPRAGLDGCGKPRPPAGFDPRTVQAVASRYTDWDILAHVNMGRESVLSGRGLCDELITRPEKSYWLWCVVVCDLETTWMRRPWPTGGCCAKNKKKKICVRKPSSWRWTLGFETCRRHRKKLIYYFNKNMSCWLIFYEFWIY